MGKGGVKSMKKKLLQVLAKRQPWIGKELMAIGSAVMARERLIEATRWTAQAQERAQAPRYGLRRHAPGRGEVQESEATGTGWIQGQAQWGIAEEEIGACEATAMLTLDRGLHHFSNKSVFVVASASNVNTYK